MSNLFIILLTSLLSLVSGFSWPDALAITWPDFLTGNFILAPGKELVALHAPLHLPGTNIVNYNVSRLSRELMHRNVGCVRITCEMVRNGDIVPPSCCNAELTLDNYRQCVNSGVQSGSFNIKYMECISSDTMHPLMVQFTALLNDFYDTVSLPAWNALMKHVHEFQAQFDQMNINHESLMALVRDGQARVDERFEAFARDHFELRADLDASLRANLDQLNDVVHYFMDVNALGLTEVTQLLQSVEGMAQANATFFSEKFESLASVIQTHDEQQTRDMSVMWRALNDSNRQAMGETRHFCSSKVESLRADLLPMLYDLRDSLSQSELLRKVDVSTATQRVNVLEKTTGQHASKLSRHDTALAQLVDVSAAHQDELKALKQQVAELQRAIAVLRKTDEQHDLNFERQGAHLVALDANVKSQPSRLTEGIAIVYHDVRSAITEVYGTVKLSAAFSTGVLSPWIGVAGLACVVLFVIYVKRAWSAPDVPLPMDNGKRFYAMNPIHYKFSS